MGQLSPNNLAARPTIWNDCDIGFTEKLLETRRSEVKAFAIALRDKQFLDYIATEDGDETFSDLIQLAVKEYGVSQREIALATNSTASTVSRWMSGNAAPARYTRKSIVEAIGMIIDHNLDL